ncbi:MAG: cysteine desulfurase [Gammaproteobacteria bacterium]|nr:cysteine desulfurase [Gammaproteobacteria bacterium]
MSIYLDHNATTPIAAEVLEAMLPYLQQSFGNPSTLHQRGRGARQAIEQAREQVAVLAGGLPSELYFTSGGTEANNSLLKGLVSIARRPMLAIGATEHPSVTLPAEGLKQSGVEVSCLKADSHGVVAMDSLEQWAYASRESEGRVLSLMAANNETGVMQPMAEVAAFAEAEQILFHSDAVQLAGKAPLAFGQWRLGAMSLSAHKLYGPQGVGALLVRHDLRLRPLLEGGGQERGIRAGTENVAAIVGFGVAAELAQRVMVEESRRQLQLRRQMEAELQRRFSEVVIFAQEVERLPNTLLFALPGITGNTVVQLLDQQGFALSSGSACGSDRQTPNPRLAAMGVAPEVALAAVRITLGRDNRKEDIPPLMTALEGVVHLAGKMVNRG